jgi:hypothetical protein
MMDQTGLHLALTPSPVLDLVRQPPAAAIRLYPPGAGIGAAVGAAAESAIRVLLNLLIDHRNDATATPVRAVGRAVHELGDGLGMLVTDHFTDGTIDALASSPATTLLARLPNLVSSGLSALASIDPSAQRSWSRQRAAAPVASASAPAAHPPRPRRHDMGWTSGSTSRCSTRPTRMGHVVLEHLRLTPTGIRYLRASVHHRRWARHAVPAGRGAGWRHDRHLHCRIGVGLALDPAGAGSVEVRWTSTAARRPHMT